MTDEKTQLKAQYLDVYSASAGSGKTYTLASRYLDLLINNPNDYRRILAVTFTNKATAEMMSRIINDLYIISYAGTNAKTLKHQNELIMRQQQCMKNNGAKVLNSEVIKERCKTSLRLLLNDYRMFCVSTIDSFVQRVIRAFAFEMGFASSYGIELDSDLIIQEAIDNMMRSLSEPHNEELRKWLIASINSSIDEGKWSIDTDIFKLAKKILEDDGRSFMDDITSKLKKNAQLMNDIKTSMQNIISTCEEKAKQAISKYANAFPNGFPVDTVKKKSKAISYSAFNICSDTKRKTSDKLLELKKKEKNCKTFNDSSDNKDVDAAFITLYNELPSDNDLKDYYTAKIIVKNIYVIGIMSHLSAQITNWKRQNDTLPMSDSNDLLRRLIDGCDIPFIYEKIGARFSNIMIDEFQDTSNIQWDNFKPLIDNCISESKKNLLVGDTKQSIYRWRNSDWRNLANIGLDMPCTQNNLETNWRSLPTVVAFNNAIFSNLKEQMARQLADGATEYADIKKVFSSCTQKVPNNKQNGDNGYVQIRAISKPQNNAESQTEEDTIEQIIIQELIAEINKLHNEYAYEYGDICVLVRQNNEGSMIMEALHKVGIDAVSTDSLKLTNSAAVVGLIGALRYMTNNNDKPSLITFLSASKFANINNANSSLNISDTITNQLQNLNGMGLVEIISKLISDFLDPQLVQRDFMFIEAFTDSMRSYMTKGHANLSDFIDFIDKYEDNISVIAPPSRDAVKVMTIHKSKGLEFKAVLIPFADWKLLKYNDIIWCPTTNTDKIPDVFKSLKLLPMPFNSNMEQTWFADAYLNEKRLQHIDSLNMLYVAFTRAENVLMIWGEKREPSKNEDANPYTTIFDYILESVSNNNPNISVEFNDGKTSSFKICRADTPNDPNITFSVGNIPQATTKPNSNATELIEQYPLHTWNIKMAKNSLDDDDELVSNRQIGILMHSIMEKIGTLSDLDTAFATAISNGELSTDEAQIVKKHIDNALDNPIAHSWFDVDATHVYNEMSFFAKGENKRPDRVIIDNNNNVTIVDYKFCQKNDANQRKYTNQVSHYANLFRQIGYTNVCGYVWYLGDTHNYQPEIVSI